MDSQKDTIGQKAKKLCLGAYMVTNFTADADPIKWKLRDKALDLVSHIETAQVDLAVKDIDQILSYIEVALMNKSASEMNFSILRKEYAGLKDLILKSRADLTILGQLSVIPIVSHKSLKTSPRPVNTDRRGQILGFIRQKGWSSIKEIAQAVPNFSSKTVQRELSELVKAGRLKKEGERRWSRYLVDE
ncbi:MAG: hypothetical protein HYT48_03125 [Candidatus Vogelbacteria bacterium]|nr:hypothetical protein [Candidatus Vogelbacteria bacterium]